MEAPLDVARLHPETAGSSTSSRHYGSAGGPRRRGDERARVTCLPAVPADSPEIDGALGNVSEAVTQYLAGLGDAASDIQWLEAISARAAALDKVAIEMREDRADTSPVSVLGQIKKFAQDIGREARALRA